MRKIKTLLHQFLLLTFVLVFYACEDEGDNTILSLSPENFVLTFNSEEVVTFTLTGETTSEFKNVNVLLKAQNDYSESLMDSAIYGEKIDLKYELKIPTYISDTSIVDLSFRLQLANGEKVQISKRLLVVSGYKLNETSGHVLYSGSSGEPNAYNLLAGKPLYYNEKDTVNIHIADTSSIDLNSDAISRKLISNTGVRFVRFNDFDYANATIQNLYNSFQAGLAREFIHSVQDEDIILLEFDRKKTPESYGVIYITEVIDKEGTINDKYIFSLKR